MGSSAKVIQEEQCVQLPTFAVAPLVRVVCSCPYTCLTGLGQVTCFPIARLGRKREYWLMGGCVGGLHTVVDSSQRRLDAGQPKPTNGDYRCFSNTMRCSLERKTKGTEKELKVIGTEKQSQREAKMRENQREVVS